MPAIKERERERERVRERERGGGNSSCMFVNECHVNCFKKYNTFYKDFQIHKSQGTLLIRIIQGKTCIPEVLIPDCTHFS